MEYTMAKLQVRVDDTTAAALTRIAADEGVTVSALIRDALVSLVKGEAEPTVPTQPTVPTARTRSAITIPVPPTVRADRTAASDALHRVPTQAELRAQGVL